MAAGWEHVNVGDFVKDKACHLGWNEEWQSWDVDEDKVRFALSAACKEGLLTSPGLVSSS